MGALIFVSIFGLVGVTSRFAIDRWLVDWTEPFPMSTFFVNVIGCALAGTLYVVGERNSWSAQLQTGLLVGFCGGFTTFSAYALQVVTMVERGRITPAITYLVVSPILGFAAAYAPIYLLRRV